MRRREHAIWSDVARDKKQHRNIVEWIKFRYFPYWPLFVLLILLAVAVAWAYLRFKPPVYEIRARLLFDRLEQNGVPATDSTQLSMGERATLEVLTSRTLVEEVVRRLNLSSQVYTGGLLHDIPAFSSAPIATEVRDITKIQSGKRIPLVYNSREGSLLLDGEAYKLDTWIRSQAGEIRFVKNANARNTRSGTYYVLFRDFRTASDDVLDRLRVTTDESGPGVVLIRFRDRDARRGEKVIDTLISVFQQQVSGTRLLDRAIASAHPVAPRPALVYPIVIVTALLLSVGWVTWKEQLGSTILFRTEIEAATNVPIAAEISDSEMKDYVVVDNLRKPQLTEQFIQMRAAIQLYGDKGKSVVMVTSSNAGEGKTFVSANFAISLTTANHKVLLVDLDFRNPRLSSLYNIAAIAGIADVLSGEATLQETIRPTAVQNMYLLSAGKHREKATNMLMDGDLAGLLEKLRKTFDFIVIDTPPVTPVIDGYVISPLCDVTLFVMRHGSTPKTALEPFRANGKVTTLKNLNIVFNGVRPRGMIKTEYPYGYGSTYDYPVTPRKRFRWF